MKKGTTEANRSSDKLLNLLEVLSDQPVPLRLQDIARLCDMNPSTALRFLTALQKRNYVAQETATSRYYVTLKLCALAQSITGHSNIRSVAMPFMREISAAMGESCNLAMESDLMIMYMEVTGSPGNTLITTQRIGNVAPMHCTGVGKLFLSEFTEDEMNRFYDSRKLTSYTDSTITSRARLEKELLDVGRQGYAFDNEECEQGVRCIALPIRDYTGSLCAALSVSGPSVRMTDEKIYKHLDYLLETAQRLSAYMGFEGREVEN